MNARDDYPNANSGTHSDYGHSEKASLETQDALDEIDRLRKINKELVCSHNDRNLLSVLIPDNDREILTRRLVRLEKLLDESIHEGNNI
jgi:hypothetical protein